MLSDMVVDLSGTVSYATDIFVDISVYINALATKTLLHTSSVTKILARVVGVVDLEKSGSGVYTVSVSNFGEGALGPATLERGRISGARFCLPCVTMLTLVVYRSDVTIVRRPTYGNLPEKNGPSRPAVQAKSPDYRIRYDRLPVTAY